jgi:hypothetical protein
MTLICIINEFLVYRYDPQFCVLTLSKFCKILRYYNGDHQDHITGYNTQTYLLRTLNVSES